MSGRWFRVYDAALDDPIVQRLSARAFRREFMSAIEGNMSVFDRFIKPDSGRPSATEWSTIRARIFERDDYTCQYCGVRGVRLECDHVIAVSRGGSNADDNLKTACFPCNRSKRAKSLENWQAVA